MRARAWLIPAIVLLALVAMFAAVIFIAGNTGDSGAPPRPADFVAPQPSFPTVALDVQQVAAGGVITFANDQGQPDGTTIPPGAIVEVLRPIDFGDIPVGAEASLIGEPNDVRSFVVRTIVVFGVETVTTGVDAGVRSRGGFEGWEAGRDRTLRVILSGTVTAVSADGITMDTATGALTIARTEIEEPRMLPVYLLSEEDTGAIVAGARVAFPAAGQSPDPDAEAVLVLPR
jgi:hypothetical protein